MTTYISLLRGINVSGQKKIRMEELRQVYEGLNFGNIRTYVQSGNVLFDSASDNAPLLTASLEAQIERHFGYPVAVFLRDLNDFQRLLKGNPFTNGRNEDPARLYVTFLQSTPSESSAAGLAAPGGTQDEFFLYGREIFLFCPKGYGVTKLSNNFFERKLKLPATTRNWRTVNALHQMALSSS